MDRDALLAEAGGLIPEGVCAEFLALAVVEDSHTPGFDVTIRVDGARASIPSRQST